MASSSANAASMKVILITIVGGLMLFTLPTVLVLGIGYPYALTLIVAGAFTAFIYFQF